MGREKWSSCQSIRSILITTMNGSLLMNQLFMKLHIISDFYNEIIEYKNIELAILDI